MILEGCKMSKVVTSRIPYGLKMTSHVEKQKVYARMVESLMCTHAPCVLAGLLSC